MRNAILVPAFSVVLAFSTLIAGPALGFGGPASDPVVGPDRLSSAEDEAALAAIARLPVGDRSNVLEASLHPELVAEIGALLADTSASFRGIAESVLEPYRATVYELGTQPNLLDALLDGGAPSAVGVAQRLEGRPQALIVRIEELVESHPDLLDEVVGLRAWSELGFEELLVDQAAGTQAIFRSLLRKPDVLALLTGHPDVVAMLGETYWRDAGEAENLLASYRGERPPGPGPTGERLPDPPTQTASLGGASLGGASLGGASLGSPSGLGINMIGLGRSGSFGTSRAPAPASGFASYSPVTGSIPLRSSLDPRLTAARGLWSNVGRLALRPGAAEARRGGQSAPRLGSLVTRSRDRSARLLRNTRLFRNGSGDAGGRGFATRSGGLMQRWGQMAAQRRASRPRIGAGLGSSRAGARASRKGSIGRNVMGAIRARRAARAAGR